MSVKSIKFIDKRIGNLLCAILGSFSKCKKPDKAENILVIQLWGIGETILALPAIRALRNRYKKAKITVLATKRNSDIFYNDKDINKIILLKLNPFSILHFIIKEYKKYDFTIDMEEYLNISAIISFFVGKYRIGYSHNARSRIYNEKVRYNDRQHAMQTFLDLARALKAGYKEKKLIKLNYSVKDRNTINNFLKHNKISKKDFLIGIAPGAAESGKARMWPWRNYAELCNNILNKDKKSKIILIGNKEENKITKKIQNGIKEKARIINTAGLFNLNALFCLIEKCNLFIGNDSGPMHIAAAQGVKTIGLFGPNLPVRFGPYGKGNAAVYKGYNCRFSPCINVHKGQVPDCLFPKNSEDYQKCMKNIKVEDIMKQLNRLY